MTERMYALVDLPAEVHSIPGAVCGGRFRSDRPHVMEPDCDCHPAVIWGSDAAPRPLYEHRDAAGQLHQDAGPVQ